jgi:hypothetical protein
MIPLATLGFKLLGIGRWIWSAIRAGVKWALSDWRHLVIVAVSLFAAYNYIGASKWQGRAERALATVEARDKTIADMTAASEAARVKQIAINDKRTQDEKDNANDADKNDRIAQLEAGNRATVYRDRWRVRNICQSSAAGADSAPESAVAESGNGAGDIADMVAISGADFDRCTANSVRLQSVKQWGDGLIAKKLAVPVD